MQQLKSVFSGAVDASKVNPWGLMLMLLGVLAAALAQRLAAKIRPESPEAARNAVKLVGMLVCAGGALLAILG